MDNKCPKCSAHLSIFYLKPECPKCGCNLMYYNMENRLDEDAEKAEAEYAKLYALIDKITPKFIKNKRNNKESEGSENGDRE